MPAPTALISIRLSEEQIMSLDQRVGTDGFRNRSDVVRESVRRFLATTDISSHTVELKNDLAVSGVLVSVDQYLNIKLKHTQVVEEAIQPHLKSVRNCFIRGSVVRYVQMPSDAIDVDVLHDATRREARGS